MEAGQALPPLETKEYHVQSYYEPCCLFWVGLSFGFPCLACLPGPTVHTLRLEPEEVKVTSKNACMNANRRIPYGELGGVDRTTGCGVYGFGGGALGSMSPGWGGEEELPVRCKLSCANLP